MTIAVITAIYDDYDTLKPTLEQNTDVEWICVTDSYSSVEKGESGWKIINEPRPHLHPNRAAKTPKCLPWLYTDAASSIWIDASYQVVSPTFAEDVLSYADPIAQFAHPWRQCVYAEADESLLLPKYKDEAWRIKAQIQDMHRREHPYDWGLWATGVIARHHCQSVMHFGFDWLYGIYQYSYQDQLSHPVALRDNMLDITDLPGTHLSNEWLVYQGSGRH